MKGKYKMNTLSNLIMEMYNEVMYQIENNLFEERLNSKESFRKAIALWKNLPEGKKESEAKRILKASKREGYTVKQKDILAYADKIEDYSKMKAKKSVRKDLRSKKSNKFIEKFKTVAEKVKNTKDSDLDTLTNFELKAYLYSKGEDIREVKFKPRNLLFRMLTAHKEEPKRALTLSGKLLDILNKHDLNIPLNHPKYKEMDLVDGIIEVKYENVTKIGTFQRKENIKAGKVVKELFPEIDDIKLQKVLDDLTGEKKIQGKTFKVFPSGTIGQWYRKLEEKGTSSCMSGSCYTNLISFYDKLGSDISIVIMYNGEAKDENAVGRALLWNKVKGIAKPYLDRTYPSHDVNANTIFKEYAKQNGWVYRSSVEITKKGNSANADISYQIPENVWPSIEKMPYMDTFTYGNNEGLISNTTASDTVYTFTSTIGTLIKNSKFKGDETYEGDLDLSDLESIPKNFVFPKVITGGLYLNSLTSIPEGVKFPEGLERLNLSNLTSIPKGLKFPERLEYLNLSNLTSIPEGVKFPEGLEYLYLSRLKSIPEGVKFPEGLKDLYLSKLTSIPDGVKFPEGLKYLILGGLTSIPKDFKFPEGLKDLYLTRLDSIPEGFKFPEGLTDLYLSLSLKDEFKQRFPNLVKALK
jgi:hypothetical protein